MSHWRALALWFSLCVPGCATRSVPEPVRTVAAAIDSTEAGTGEAGASIPGYLHTINASHFKIGTNVTLETNTPQIQRWRGSLGAFAVDPSNGSACALLDAKSPTGPYDLDVNDNAANVKSYFVGAGLPSDQIGDIQNTYQSAGMGGSTADAAPVNFQLQSVTSIIRRVVSGILVVESEAWATITTTGDVDMECVFWPPLDSSVVNAAIAWASATTNSTAHAAFLANLPSNIQKDVGVVIHHSDRSVHSPTATFASYDVVLNTSPGAATRHFDQNGVEFRLPQEAAQQVAVGSGPRPTVASH